MHPQSPPLSIGGTVLKKSDVLVILGVTFVILGVLVILGVTILQFWSIVLQSGARLPIHTLNYWTEQSVVPGF